VAELCLST